MINIMKRYLTIYQNEDGKNVAGPIIEAKSQHEAYLKLKNMQDANLASPDLEIAGEIIQEETKDKKDGSER